MNSARFAAVIARRSAATLPRQTRARYLETKAISSSSPEDADQEILNRPTRTNRVLNESTSGISAGSKNYYGWDTLRVVKPLNIPDIPPSPPTGQRLVCTLKLSSHMPDHIDFLSFFAIHSAKAMSIPCTQNVIHLPTDWKKWNLIKSPFIFAKSKEIFEEKVYHRAVQLFDVDRLTVNEWVKYVVSRLPDGVDAQVDRYEWTTLADALNNSNVDDSSDDSRSQVPLAFTDCVRAEMDAWLAQYEASKVAPRAARPAAPTDSDDGRRKAESSPQATQEVAEKKVSAKRTAALAGKAAAQQRGTEEAAAGKKKK
ncbi:hypothetical protein SeLEV6574_g02536 [Synchytrium endobioticum]|uniref:Small ribosomal subunit protein uS10m n=1 Tax=Synchytrium endobioticum TaxID=286115 RepID=A0A507D9R7_9FUNG|nr:hypothetical protein SeLEV6574_g02536 [Synchytrium endobioticum]